MGFVIVVGTVDTVDISVETVYLDEVLWHLPDVGSGPLTGPGFPVDRCGAIHSQAYPQEKALFGQIHILEDSLDPVHIWGCCFQ
jgi:hypothetical protein